MNALARLAALEFAQRKRAIDEAVAQRRFHRDQGERNLRLWLSIACASGCAPRDLTTLLADWQSETGHGDATARYILLEDGPPRAEWLAELARARDTAAAKAKANPADTALRDRALTLVTLVTCLDPPIPAHPEPVEGRAGAPEAEKRIPA